MSNIYKASNIHICTCKKSDTFYIKQHLLLLQHKLKFSQRDKVKKFITFTQTGEQTAIYCLAQNDWKLDLASDNYFQNPDLYYKEPKNSVDKKKLEVLYNKYQGNFSVTVFVF